MTDATPATRASLPLHWKMAIGFGVGLIVGLIVHATGQGDAGWVQDVTKYVTTPFSKIFLNLIFMLIVPLLFSALVCGIAEMGDIRALGRIGWKTLAYTVLLSAVAVLLGLLLVNLLKPGVGVDPALAQQLIAENADRTIASLKRMGRICTFPMICRRRRLASGPIWSCRAVIRYCRPCRRPRCCIVGWDALTRAAWNRCCSWCSPAAPITCCWPRWKRQWRNWLKPDRN